MVNRQEMAELGRQIRVDVLKMCERTNTGHVGSAFSVADILAVLYSGIANVVPSQSDRDMVILSKGHACAALYSALWRKGILNDEQFNSFTTNGTLFGHHAPYIPELCLDMNTGSLGQGLSVGAGIALANVKSGCMSHTFVIMSDGETNEGSVWEAANFAAHHGLSNLCMILDANEIQAMGATRDILNPGDHVSRWKAFGWDAVSVDGHSVDELVSAFSRLGQTRQPLAIIARTIKGKGVSFMEKQLLWHYRQPKGEEFESALKELEQ